MQPIVNRPSIMRRVCTALLIVWALVLCTASAQAGESRWQVVPFAGNGELASGGLAYNGEAASSVPIGQVRDLAQASNGDIYVLSSARVGAGPEQEWILRVDPAGRVYTIGGGGTGFCDSCNARATDIHESYHLTIAPDQSIWYTEAAFNRRVVRRIDPATQVVSTVAGKRDEQASDGDGGPALAAHVAGARGIAAAPDGSVYLVDNGIDGSGPYSVRRLTPDRMIVRVAGTAGSLQRWQADTRPALATDLTRMEDIAVDPADGSVWFTEAFRNVVRRVTNPMSFAPTIEVSAGLHDFGRDDACSDTNPDAMAVAAYFWNGVTPPDGTAALGTTFCALFGLSFDPLGTRLYLSDVDNRRIRRLDIAQGTVSSVVGTGAAGRYGYLIPAGTITLHDDWAVLATARGILFADQTGDGNTLIASIANRTPLARVIAADSSPVQFRPVALDASGSSDPDGGPLAYSWDYGDGAHGATTGGATEHTYTTAGAHTVTVTVQDEDGGTASATSSLTVRAFQLPPIAAFAAALKRLPGGRYRLTLDGSPSFDADGAINGWRWQFSDAKTGAGKVLTRTFAKLPKKLGVVLSVVNAAGLKSNETAGTIMLPPVVKATAHVVLDSDHDSIPNSRDHCRRVKATIDPNHDGCNGPYAVPHVNPKKLGILVRGDPIPFGVALTTFAVVGFASGAQAQLVCDHGCGPDNVVLASSTVTKKGTATVDLAGHRVDAGAQLSVRASHRNWVGLSLPLLIRASATGGSVATAGNGNATCSISSQKTVSFVACPA